MATGVNLGTAFIQISPSMSGVSKAVERELGGLNMKSAGARMGARLGESMQGSLRDAMKKAATAASDAAYKGREGALKSLTSAEDSYSRALASQHKALQGLTDAQQRLKDLRGSGASATQLAKAEQGVATAAKAAAQANLQSAGALGSLNQAKDAAQAASTKYQQALAMEQTLLGKVAAQFPVIGERMQAAGSKISSFGDAVSGVGTSLTKNITAPAVTAAGAVGGLVAVLGFKRLVGIDTARGQFQGLGYDADAVMQQVDAGVTNTSLSMAEGAAAAVGILATGSVPLEDLEAQIKRVANVSAAYPVEAGHAAYLLNNILTKNKVTWGDLSQMQMNNIPVVTMLADHYGVAGDAIQDMAARGEISIEDLNAAIDAKAGAAAEEYNKTWTGITKNILSNIGRIGAAMMGPSFDILKEKAADLLAFLKNDELTAWATDAGARIGEVTGSLIDFAERAIDAWNGLSPEAQKTIGIIAGAAVALGPALIALGKITTLVGGAVSGIGGLVSSIGGIAGGAAAAGGAAGGLGGILGGLSKFAGPVGIIVSLITGMIAASPELRESLGGAFETIMGVVGDLLDVLGPLIGDIMTALTPVLGTLGGLFATVIDALMPLIEMLGPVLTPIIGLLAAILEPVIGLLVAILDPIIALVQWVVELIAPVIELAAAFLAIGIEWLADLLTSVLVPAFEWLGDVIDGVVQWFTDLGDTNTETGQGFQDIWAGITGFFQGIWDGVAAVFTWFYESIIKPIIDGITWQVENIFIPIFETLYAVFSFIWDAISAVIQIAWGVFSFVFTAIVDAVAGFLAPIFTWLYENVISPVWEGIKQAINIAWGVINMVFLAIVNAIQSFLAPIFTWLYENIIRPVWDGIQGAIRTVADWFRDNVVPIWDQATSTIAGAFQKFQGIIEDVWEAIKVAAMAPVKFVVETVYTDGIKSLFDDIAAAVGLDVEMPPAPALPFASGGVLPGWSPGRDIHMFTSPTGGRLALSGGEAIMRPEFTAAVGGAAGVAALNAAARAGRLGDTHAFADGGIWDFVGDTFGAAGDWISSVAGSVAAIIADPLGSIDRLILEPVKSALAGLGGGFFGNAVGEMPFMWVDGIKDWFSGLIAPTTQGVNGNWTGGDALARVLQMLVHFPGLFITDTYRDPAYNAAVGGSPTSYHMDPVNPAVDIAGPWDQMNAFAAMAYAMPAGTWRQILWQVAGHYDHVHVAAEGGVFGDLPTRTYDSGGVLSPGLTLAYNGTGKDEYIRTNEQEAALQRRLRRFPERVVLEVEGREFTAYVREQATDVSIRTGQEAGVW